MKNRVCIFAVAAWGLLSTACLAQSSDWVGDAVGDHDLKSAKSCVGSVDVLKQTSEGIGAQGWAWNTKDRSVPESILLVDENDAIIGVASSGNDRPDVTKALPDVTSDKTGWSVETKTDSPVDGTVTVYALLDDDTICQIGPPKNITR